MTAGWNDPPDAEPPGARRPDGYWPGGYSPGGSRPGDYPGGYGPGAPGAGGYGPSGPYRRPPSGPGPSGGAGPPAPGPGSARPGGLSNRGVAWLVGIAAVLVLLLATHTIHVQQFYVIYVCVLIPSIILHEISHGAVAKIFGDDTAQRAGRLTLNPVPHIDPLGSIILPGLLLLSGTGMAFGWAKPVPVNVSKLRHPRNDSILVSLAGPATNGLLFVACALAYRFSLAHGLFLSPNDATMPLGYEILFVAGLANITVGFFNLLPIPPLDGSALVERLLPARAVPRYYQLRGAGMVIVLLFFLFVFRNAAVETHLLNAEIHLWNAVSGAGL